jgi:2-succinyl-6-hydroxy-2,4-cyclohexadiene-1-carboxylate synthase
MQNGVVLLHGFLGSPESFASVIPAFRSSISAFCPPLYGHAGLREQRPLLSFEDETARLYHLIRDHFPAERVHLVGYSLGGRLGLSLLIRYPALFRSATLISARRGLDTTAEREQRWESDLRWAERLQSDKLFEFLDAWEEQPIFSSMRQMDPGRLRWLREQRLKHDAEGLAQALVGLSLSRMPSYAEELADVHLPVALVYGALDAKFIELGEELAARLPNSKTVVVDGSGHNLPFERPAALASVIAEGMNHD